MALHTFLVGGAWWMYPSIQAAVDAVPGPTPSSEKYHIIVSFPNVFESVLVTGGRVLSILPFPNQRFQWTAHIVPYGLRVEAASDVYVENVDFVVGNVPPPAPIDPDGDTEGGRGIQVHESELYLLGCTDYRVQNTAAGSDPNWDPGVMVSVEGESSHVEVHEHFSLGGFEHAVAIQQGELLVMDSLYFAPCTGSMIIVRYRAKVWFWRNAMVGVPLAHLLSGAPYPSLDFGIQVTSGSGVAPIGASGIGVLIGQ
jgi:hypothetical protein